MTIGACFYQYKWFGSFFKAEGGIRDLTVTGVQTCALPIFGWCDPAKYVVESPSNIEAYTPISVTSVVVMGVSWLTFPSITVCKYPLSFTSGVLSSKTVPKPMLPPVSSQVAESFLRVVSRRHARVPNESFLLQRPVRRR